AFRPRALFERFRIDFLATTEGAHDDLDAHHRIRASGWNGRVVTTYRPDSVIDVEHEQFGHAMRHFAELTGEDVYHWHGYLAAHRTRRAAFRAAGATATDHGHPTVLTANLSTADAEALFGRIVGGTWSATDAELFRAQMLTEMARMSLDDGMVMQIHPGSYRNHNAGLFASHGRDKGADIPTRTEFVRSLKPMLDVVGNSDELTIILFTLDESVYARELAPLAGHYPCLRLGPAWWFHDSPEGMRRFREMTMETAGFYNTVGFNDDTRAFLSIPARHDVARRVDCAFLAKLVAEHRLVDWEAADLAQELTSGLRAGIVHLGIGAFHRAHQAVYTDLAMAAGDRDWAITGVSLRSRQVHDQLTPQNGLYTVTERRPGGDATRLIGAVTRVVVAPDEPGRVVAALTAPATRIVTLTVTEKGYAPNEHESAAADAAPTTIYDYLAAAVVARLNAGSSPLTLISCDNLSNNGRVLHERLCARLEAISPQHRRWFEQAWTCPSTMVDRIVPATTAADLNTIEAALGQRDEGAVITEPY
ncbi:hypothetical protein LTR94_025965, partial [Friedmanniomyces endolithicus]